jgi:hypothetical protein
MALREIMRAHELVAGSTNSAGRWNCQEWSLSAVNCHHIHEKCLLEVLIETCILHFVNTGCHDWIVSI